MVYHLWILFQRNNFTALKVRTRTNWEYVSAGKEIINSFGFRKRIRYMWSLDFSSVKAGGQEISVTSERSLNLEEKFIFSRTLGHVVWLGSRAVDGKTALGERGELFVQFPFWVFSFRSNSNIKQLLLKVRFFSMCKSHQIFKGC